MNGRTPLTDAERADLVARLGVKAAAAPAPANGKTWHELYHALLGPMLDYRGCVFCDEERRQARL